MSNIHELSSQIGEAAERLARSGDVSDLLDRFWSIQDSLHRMVELMVESGREERRSASAEMEKHRTISKVLLLLQDAQEDRLAVNAGIRASCEAISKSLASLMQMKGATGLAAQSARM